MQRGFFAQFALIVVTYYCEIRYSDCLSSGRMEKLFVAIEYRYENN